MKCSIFFVAVLLQVSCFLFSSAAYAQETKLTHRIGTVSGVFNFAYNPTPDQLVQIYGPSTGFTSVGVWKNNLAF